MSDPDPQTVVGEAPEYVMVAQACAGLPMTTVLPPDCREILTPVNVGLLTVNVHGEQVMLPVAIAVTLAVPAVTP